MFVVLARSTSPEPRHALGRTGRDAPTALARDIKDLEAGTTNVLDQNAFIFPIKDLNSLTAGEYTVQALFDSNPDLRMADAPGNLYSPPQQLAWDPKNPRTVALELTQRILPEQMPSEGEQVKFVRLQSKLLSEFHHRPIYLRAGIILPKDYGREPGRHYPLWVRVGGFNTRYTGVSRMMDEGGEFSRVWKAEDTPRFIMLLVDGAGPYGDPYYVNSANNGPYGDALTQELIPYVEQKFRGKKSRVLSGVSTGGWVGLALQIFYPDYFDGTWVSCPDPVDFRAFELVNIYEDQNAYTDGNGQERPSERNLRGDIVLTMRQEVGAENLLGQGDSYTRSGGQWGSWDAVYSPRGVDGLPRAIWDPQTGKIDHSVAEQWKKYDLRFVLEQNWKTLGPKLKGKLHIASGEADQYYLNNAMHLLDQFLAHAEPPFGGKIVFGPGKGHGWMDLTMRQILEEMQKAIERERK